MGKDGVTKNIGCFEGCESCSDQICRVFFSDIPLGLGCKQTHAELRCRCKLDMGVGWLERTDATEACEMQDLKPGDGS